MSRRIVGVEMDVWTAQEIEAALVEALLDRYDGGMNNEEISAICKGLMAELKGETDRHA